MKERIMAAVAVLLLAATLAACAPAPQLSVPTQQKPADTQPETTEPETTEPEVTGPETTEPEVTEPETTEPEVTEPEVTEPEATEPETDGDYTRAELNTMDTKVNGWGLGPAVDEENRPWDAINAQKKYGKYDAYFIAPSDGKIYLTFDEGYENGYTATILDTLKEKNVKAVFFITMQYAKNSPELVQRMIDEGHVVGNHSVRHKSMPTLTIDEMVDEVIGLHEYVVEHFGYEMHLFRPPTGEYSQQSLAVVQSLGYKTVEWSFAYYDYAVDDQPDNQKAYDKIVKAAHSGAIYLLHAVSKTNTEVLGDVIDAFRSQGFELALMENDVDWAGAA